MRLLERRGGMDFMRGVQEEGRLNTVERGSKNETIFTKSTMCWWRSWRDRGGGHREVVEEVIERSWWRSWRGRDRW